jgi:hypothetical protein
VEEMIQQRYTDSDSSICILHYAGFLAVQPLIIDNSNSTPSFNIKHPVHCLRELQQAITFPENHPCMVNIRPAVRKALIYFR